MHQQAAVTELSSSTATGWQLPAEPGAGLFPPPQPPSSDGAGPSGDGFADAFAGLPDPFSSDFRASFSSGGGPGPADFFDFEAPAAAVDFIALRRLLSLSLHCTHLRHVSLAARRQTAESQPVTDCSTDHAIARR